MHDWVTHLKVGYLIIYHQIIQLQKLSFYFHAHTTSSPKVSIPWLSVAAHYNSDPVHQHPTQPGLHCLGHCGTSCSIDEGVQC